MPLLTTENILSLQCQQTGYTECYIASWIWKIVPFFLVVVGIIGNVLSLIVLSSQQLRKKSTCVYLMFLAVTDITLLCSTPLLHVLKNVFGVNVWLYSSFCCSFTGWMGHTSGLISCWIIVFVTAERTLLTLFPVTAKPKMTPRNALKICFAVSIVAMMLNGHLIYGRTIVERQVNITETNGTSLQSIGSCSLRPGHYTHFYQTVWKKILLVIASLVPILLIVTGNAIVAISLIKRRRALRRYQDGRVVGGTSQLSSGSKISYKVFFTICSVFIVTTVPYGIYGITIPVNKEVDDHYLARYQLAAAFLRCLVWSNFSFNFFLYVLAGSLFRQELWRLFESGRACFNLRTTRSHVNPQTDQRI